MDTGGQVLKASLSYRLSLRSASIRVRQHKTLSQAKKQDMKDRLKIAGTTKKGRTEGKKGKREKERMRKGWMEREEKRKKDKGGGGKKRKERMKEEKVKRGKRDKGGRLREPRETKSGRRHLAGGTHSHANSGDCLVYQQHGGSFRVLVYISLIPHHATPKSPIERLISFHENNVFPPP